MVDHTEAGYQRCDYLEKRRTLSFDWAAYCSEIFLKYQAGKGESGNAISNEAKLGFFNAKNANNGINGFDTDQSHYCAGDEPLLLPQTLDCRRHPVNQTKAKATKI